MSESATKRKANGAADGDRSAKRAKISDTAETPDTTYEKGQDFLRTIKASKDKTGRSIIDEFLTLPDADEVPGYYDQIKLPLAVDVIEDKLKRRLYPNLTSLESDFKRMVQNAKDFNTRGSVIFEDAERVRKGASNWFVRHNPAYNDKSYQAKPTPLPGEPGGGSLNGTPTPAAAPITLKLTNKAASVRKEKERSRTPAKSATPFAAAVDGAADDEMNVDAEGEVDGEVVSSELADFKGLSFQKAQERVIKQLIDYTDPSDESNPPLLIFTPFHFLPPRDLADYYQTIDHPVSLKAIEKLIRGKVGHKPATGVSTFKTWDEFEKELTYVWENCRKYNEDGSEMFMLAGEFEEVAKERLQLAREQAPGPKGVSIKLNMSAGKATSPAPKSQTIKLKLGAAGARGGASASPAPEKGSERGTPGIVVDGEASQRQKDFVAAASTNSNGRPASATGKNPFGSSTRSTGTPIPPLTRGVSATSPAPLQLNGSSNGVKAEGQSPALSAIRPTSAVPSASMPPPNSRPVSGSPHPQSMPGMYGGANGTANPVQANVYQPPPAANTFVASKMRPAGTSVKDSILPILTVQSSPYPSSQSPSSPPPQPTFRRTIKAHPRLIDQSVTYTVPASRTASTFQIIPYLPPSVTSRAYRIFVSVNGQRVSATVRPGEEQDRARPVYECRLERGGVGRIEVEVLAEKVLGRKKVVEGEGVVNGEVKEGVKDGVKKKEDEVERERVVVFVHVTRS